MFQPTPTHGGRPPVRRAERHRLSVSTHAHARWATVSWQGIRAAESVSTHAHARWATTLPLGILFYYTVSTHAHARWATSLEKTPSRSPASFNPRPRTVGDFARKNSFTFSSEFQPTPTHGGRLVGFHVPCTWISVSTHAHARWATFIAPSYQNVDTSFNPRPRTVGDVYATNWRYLVRKFQPTPTHGGRPDPLRPRFRVFSVSTHAHARWATRELNAFRDWLMMFQPTPTHGGRPARRRARVKRLSVSTHAHARWATW